MITDWKLFLNRSFEQEIRNNFGIRNGNYEKNAVVKNQGIKQRVQRTLWDCWQWETNGHCVKGDNCSFRHDIDKRGQSYTIKSVLRILSCRRMSDNHREPEVPEEKVPVGECLDGLARSTLEELAVTHFLKNGTLQNACSTRPRVVVGLVKIAHMHIVRLMNSRQKGLKRMMTKVQWPYWRKVIGKKEDLLPTNVTIDRWKLDKRRDEEVRTKVI